MIIKENRLKSIIKVEALHFETRCDWWASVVGKTGLFCTFISERYQYLALKQVMRNRYIIEGEVDANFKITV